MNDKITLLWPCITEARYDLRFKKLSKVPLQNQLIHKVCDLRLIPIRLNTPHDDTQCLAKVPQNQPNCLSLKRRLCYTSHILTSFNSSPAKPMRESWLRPVTRAHHYSPLGLSLLGSAAKRGKVKTVALGGICHDQRLWISRASEH